MFRRTEIMSCVFFNFKQLAAYIGFQSITSNEFLAVSEPRTINSIETFNSTLQPSEIKAHSTIWKLIDWLRREISLATREPVEIQTGICENKAK